MGSEGWPGWAPGHALGMRQRAGEVRLTDDEILEAIAMEGELREELAAAEAALAAARAAVARAEAVRAEAAGRVEALSERVRAVDQCDRLVDGVAVRISEEYYYDGRWSAHVGAVSRLSRRSAHAYEAANNPGRHNVSGKILEPERGMRDSVIAWNLSREEALEAAARFVAGTSSV